MASKAVDTQGRGYTGQRRCLSREGGGSTKGEGAVSPVRSITIVWKFSRLSIRPCTRRRSGRLQWITPLPGGVRERESLTERERRSERKSACSRRKGRSRRDRAREEKKTKSEARQGEERAA